MKKIILTIVVFLVGLNFSIAQSKTETIEWLDTYPEILQDNAKYYNNFSGYQLKFFVSENDEVTKLTWMEESDDTSPYYQRTNVENIYRIILYPKEKNSQKWYNLQLYCKEGVSNILFIFQEKDSALRVYKAIKHLTTFYDTDIEFEDKVSIENKF